MQTLITNRLLLRGWTQDDAGDLLAIAGNPNVAAGAGFKPLDSRGGAAALIDGYIEQGGVWALQHRLHKKVIGVISLDEDGFRPKTIRCRALSFSLAEAYWGGGYAKEAARALISHAFEELALDMVTANHFPSNTRAKRALEKSGFAYEGTLRRALLLWDGQARDAVCWSILREEYRKPPVTKI